VSAVSASRHPEVAKLGAEPEETKELNPQFHAQNQKYACGSKPWLSASIPASAAKSNGSASASLFTRFVLWSEAHRFPSLKLADHTTWWCSDPIMAVRTWSVASATGDLSGNMPL